MDNIAEFPEYELMYVVVNRGLGSKVLKTIKRNGINNGSVLLAMGTVSSKILEMLGLSDVSKELVMAAGEKDIIDKILVELNHEHKFEKPNSGIAYTVPLIKSQKCGVHTDIMHNDDKGAKNIMYHAITVIVEKGKAEDVIDAALKAGSKGGTIINARGSGVDQTGKLFAMEIEPEKEIVLILSECQKTEDIVQSIRNDLEIDKPENGVLYVQDVKKTYGIYK